MRLPEKTRKKSEEQLTLAKLGCCSPVSPRLQTTLPGASSLQAVLGSLTQGSECRMAHAQGCQEGNEKPTTPQSSTKARNLWISLGAIHITLSRPRRNSFWLCDDLGGLLRLGNENCRGAALGLRDCTYSGSNHEDERG